MEDVKALPVSDVPLHLRDSSYRGASTFGHGVVGYKYPHNYPGAWVEQRYLPEELDGRRYYEPGQNPTEMQIKQRMSEMAKKGDRRD